MAVVVAFRIAIMVAPFLVRSCNVSHCLDSTWVRVYENFRRRLEDPSEDPAELSSEMSAYAFALEEGVVVNVTDFTGTFELRKLQWRLSRAPSGGTIEDVDVMTFHFIKATDGTPGSYVDGTDLPAVETALDTYWGSLKAMYPSFFHSDQYRWYKDGPAFYELNDEGTKYVPITPNPAIRVTEVDVPGTSSASDVLPPQTAVTVTEKTSARTAWGRFYLPTGNAVICDNVGRLSDADSANFADYTQTFYNACRSAHMVPVVWSIQKPERPKKPSGTLPEHPATAYEISSIVVDNLFDVIRSRRYSAPTHRETRTLT